MNVMQALILFRASTLVTGILIFSWSAIADQQPLPGERSKEPCHTDETWVGVVGGAVVTSQAGQNWNERENRIDHKLIELRTAEDRDLEHQLNMKKLTVGEQFIFRLRGFIQRRVIVEERPGQPWTHRLIVQNARSARTHYVFDAIAAPGFSCTLKTYRRKYKSGEADPGIRARS